MFISISYTVTGQFSRQRKEGTYLVLKALRLRPVTRGGSGGSYEPPHEITRSGFLICIKLLIQIIT